ncbi:uncharacterized protein LOC119662308 [Teleopsis dalmanni]|uniref:uncharacterized protein LOC119662308 n=1 Tax=Teleopsis dalmanni TaxID=139649 RepID=UPI000D32C076|nr:uncharacterized protein LOC119662308 [Teleopsis dalmanni]
MAVSPFLRTPFTDLTACLINHQTYETCGEMEMNMMECMEAYGLDRGRQKCADLIADFTECSNKTKQMKRYDAMRFERFKQNMKGERPKEEAFAPPPKIDAY